MLRGFKLSCLLLISSLSSFATDLNNLDDLLASKDWSCEFTKKVNLAHGSDGSVSKLTLTMGSVKCTGPRNAWSTFNLACITPSRDVQPSVRDCQKSSVGDHDRFSWEPGILSKTAKKLGKDKHGRTCKYDTKDGLPRIAYRLVSGDTFDPVCATPIACDNFDNGPKHWIVACKSLGEVKIKTGTTEICPQPADCVEDELPLQVPHTAIDLAGFSKAISAAQNETVVSSKKKKTH